MQIVKMQNAIVCHYFGAINVRLIKFHSKINSYQLCKPCGTFRNASAYRYICTNCSQLFCLQHYIEHIVLFNSICSTGKIELGRIDNLAFCFKQAKHIKPAGIFVNFSYNFNIQSISTLLRLNQSTHLNISLYIIFDKLSHFIGNLIAPTLQEIC